MTYFAFAIAQTRACHFEVGPFHGEQPFFPEKAHADAVDAEPLVALDDVEGAREAVVEVGERKLSRLVFVLGLDGFVENAHLLLDGKLEHFVLRAFGCGHLLEPAGQSLVQLFAHERDQMGACRYALELVGHLANLSCGKQLGSLADDVLEVVGVEDEPGNGFVNALQRFQGDVGPSAASVGGHDGCHELVEGHGFRIAFSQVGEDVFDITAENRVWRDQEDVLGPEAFALLVEQIGDALHEDRRLAASGDAVDKQHGNVFVANDLVLLFFGWWP